MPAGVLWSLRICHHEQARSYSELRIPYGSELARESDGSVSAELTDQLTNVPSSVILAFNTFDTGQPSLAFLLNSSNCC